MRGLTAGALVVVMLLGGCSTGVGLRVDDAWARPTAPVADNGAFYISFTYLQGDDRLNGAESELCEMTRLHDTEVVDGVMTMTPVGPLELPKGERVEMGPGGLHIMCMGLSRPLLEGETVEVVLQFETAGSVGVEVPVEDR